MVSIKRPGLKFSPRVSIKRPGLSQVLRASVHEIQILEVHRVHKLVNSAHLYLLSDYSTGSVWIGPFGGERTIGNSLR